MTSIRMKRGLFMLAAMPALMTTPAAWAYDSAVMISLGQSTFNYQEIDSLNQKRTIKGNPGSWSLGYVGRVNEYIGFDVRWGGAGNVNSAGITMQPGLFLSLLVRPSIPVTEQVELYGLAGLTSLAVSRTLTNSGQEIIARAGSSFGMGANFRINRHMAAGIELVSYQRDVDFGPSNSSGTENWTGVNQAKVSLSSITANFKYQF